MPARGRPLECREDLVVEEVAGRCSRVKGFRPAKSSFIPALGPFAEVHLA